MGVTSLFRRKSSDDRRSQFDAGPAAIGAEDHGPSVDRLLKNRRYCAILTSTEEGQYNDQALALSWLALEDEMALVPGRELAHSDAVESQQDQERELAGIYLH